jgi:hypothetical protein
MQTQTFLKFEIGFKIIRSPDKVTETLSEGLRYLFRFGQMITRNAG